MPEVEGRMSRIIMRLREKKLMSRVKSKGSNNNGLYVYYLVCFNRLTIAFVFNQQLATILCSLQQ